MNTKDFSKMAILDQGVLQKAENGRFVVNKDYNLNEARLVVPKGMTIDLGNGSINNGTLVLDETLLGNMSPGCIDARIEGTLRNTTFYTSTCSGINNLNLSNYSDMTIYCDQNDVINTTIVLDNTNTTTQTVFDGMNNSFTCNVTFFQIRGQSNVTIRNFNATANVSGICFEDMPSTAVNVTNIIIYNNTLFGFNVSISLNCENALHTVSNCTVSDNYIANNPGISSGQGYGIHLAHANNCTISGNTVVACGRHSIYHGYGDGNSILNNTIVNHRIYQSSDLRLSAAIDVSRKSTNLVIRGNSFTNCYNVCILIYAFPHSFEPDAVYFSDKYGCCENITIENNSFHTSETSIDHGFASIMLGYLYNGDNTPYSDFINYHVKDVTIKNNTFYMTSTENLKCIRIDQCKTPVVKYNSFMSNALSSGHEKNLIEIRNVFKNVENMTALIQNNNFTAMNNITNYIVNTIGELNSLRNTLFDITVSNNTFVNQHNGSVLNYRTYQPLGITTMTSSNLHLQAEAF